jgi:hypothetical protein
VDDFVLSCSDWALYGGIGGSAIHGWLVKLLQEDTQYLRLFADIKLLVEQLDKSQLDSHISVCTFLEE